MPILLSLIVILCWSLTWIVIKLHIGHVPLEVSLFYRMTLAGLLFLAFCALRKKQLKYDFKTHLLFAAYGLFNFCVNYLFSYAAAQHLSSGVNAVVFSSLLPLNIINSATFFKSRFNLSFITLSIISLCGLALVFWPELSVLDFSDSQVVGLSLGLVGSLAGSWGNMVATYNQRLQLPILQSNTYGLLYGALFCLLYVLVSGTPMVWDWSPAYWASVGYLAIVGTIIAFTAYFRLIQLVGPAQAPFPLILVPVAALFVSQIFEGYSWTAHSIIGLACIVFANGMLLWKKNTA